MTVLRIIVPRCFRVTVTIPCLFVFCVFTVLHWHRSLSLSLCLSVCLSLSLSIPVCLSLCSCLSVLSPPPLSRSVCFCLSLCPCLSVSLPPLSVALFVFVCLSVPVCLSLSFFLPLLTRTAWHLTVDAKRMVPFVRLHSCQKSSFSLN